VIDIYADPYVIAYTRQGIFRLNYEEFSWTHRFRSSILHREDGPAMEYADGTKEWYIDGQLHREDGPATEGFNGTKRWWLRSYIHRTDGPAVERADGSKEWRLEHVEYSEEEFNKIINEVKQLPLELRLTDPRWWVREMK
jgi:hypothetical protein